MDNIGLQVQLGTGTILANDAVVDFDSTIIDISDFISYSSGVFTITKEGSYFIDWWVAVDTSIGSANLFYLDTPSGDIIGNAPNRKEQVVGNALINVTSTPYSFSLKNGSTDVIKYSVFAPIKANLTICQVNDGALFNPVARTSDSTTRVYNLNQRIQANDVPSSINVLVSVGTAEFAIQEEGYYQIIAVINADSTSTEPNAKLVYTPFGFPSVDLQRIKGEPNTNAVLCFNYLMYLNVGDALGLFADCTTGFIRTANLPSNVTFTIFKVSDV